MQNSVAPQNLKHSCHVTEQPRGWAYILRKAWFKKMHTASVHGSTSYRSQDGEGGGGGNLHGRRQQWTAPGCTSSAGHSLENELSSAICSHGAGPGDHYSRQDRERQAPRDVARMWTLKGGRDDPNSEAETSSQTQRPDLWVPRGGKAWDQQVQSPAAGWGGDKHLHSTVPSLWG